jgi:hypothetical protein
MKSLARLLVPISFFAIVAACSGGNDSSTPSAADAGIGSDADPGSADAATDASARGDGTTADAKPSVPDDTPRFVFTLGGKTITPLTLTTARGAGSAIDIKAGWKDGSIVDPDFTITFASTFSGHSTCDTEQKVQYHRWTGTSETWEYTAIGGCQMQVDRNGTDGFVEGTVTGAFASSGSPIAFSVSFTQPIGGP